MTLLEQAEKQLFLSDLTLRVIAIDEKINEHLKSIEKSIESIEGENNHGTSFEI